MNIVVAARCYNEEKNIERFLRGYDFADHIVISDGGSTDRSIEMLQANKKVRLFHFQEQETINGETWNPDNPHIQFVINIAKTYDPDWLILDDLDDVPNAILRRDARVLLEDVLDNPQINLYRLYLWGDTGKFFPDMNNNFHPNYKSLWAWRPKEVNIHADPNVRHGTLIGLRPDNYGLDIPYCLLHKSWYPDTVQDKVDRYNKLGLPMNHPSTFAGEAVDLPNWATE